MRKPYYPDTELLELGDRIYFISFVNMRNEERAFFLSYGGAYMKLEIFLIVHEVHGNSNHPTQVTFLKSVVCILRIVIPLRFVQILII